MTKAVQDVEPTTLREPRWMLLVGWLALAVGLAIAFKGVVRIDGGGLDFPVLYELGRAMASGSDVYSSYDTQYYYERYGSTQYGIFYPPTTGMVMAPLALLPYPVAMWAFTVLMMLSVVFGVRELFLIRSEAAPPSAWYIAAAIVLASAAMRWGAMLLQVAPPLFGLLCLFVGALHRGRPKLAVGIALLVLFTKMTLAAPFLGLLFIYRKFGAVFALVGSWLACNALGFWRLGPSSFAGYRENVKHLEDITNISSPDPWRPVALPRLDWMSLGYGLTKSLTISRAITVVLAAVFALWLLREWWRSDKTITPRNTALFLPALVCLNSCAVYHHQYDAIMFFAPALVAWLWLERRVTLPVLLCVPLLVIIVLLPIGKAQDVLEHWLGLFGVGLLKLSFPVAFTLALVGSMLNLSRHATAPAR